MTIGIVATLKIKAGHEAEFETVARDLVAAVKANEPGCLQYELFKSKQASTYLFLEQYANEQALGAHRETAHYKAAGPKLGAVLDGRPTIEILEKV